MSVHLVVGLGNPGRAYEATRHNAGWRVVEEFAQRLGWSWKEERAFRGLLTRGEHRVFGSIVCVRPLTFMNESGQCIRSVADFFKINVDRVLVVYDEVNLPLGRLKVSVTGSAGGHNGISSLLQHLGQGFTRLRIGIGPKNPPALTLAEFVLAPFLDPERDLFKARLPEMVAALEMILTVGPQSAMNQLNRTPFLHEQA